MYLCPNKYKSMRTLLAFLLICIFSTVIAQNGKFSWSINQLQYIVGQHQHGVILLADTTISIQVINVVNNKIIGILVATDTDIKQCKKFGYYFMSGNFNTVYKTNNTGNISVSNTTSINIRAPTTDRYVLNVRI